MPLNRRRAALVAVSSYDYLHELPCASRDVREMRDALTSGGFEIADHHILQNPQQTPQLYEWLNAVFGQAPNRSVLFLHFTGHGTRIEAGKYVFCLGKFPREGDGHAYSQTFASMVDEDLQFFIGRSQCQPTLVIVVFDACNRASRDMKHVSVWMRAHLGNAGTYQEPEVAFIYAADLDEVAEFAPQGCSYFTAAFAETIRPTHAARSVKDALQAAKQRLEQMGINQTPLCVAPLHQELLNVAVFDSPSGPADFVEHPVAAPAVRAFPYVDIPTQAGSVRLSLDCSMLREMSDAERELVVEAFLRRLAARVESEGSPSTENRS